MQLDRIEVATSAALAFAFAEHRVRTVFTLLGDGNMHFCVALAEQHGARLVHVRHEHNAVTAAMGYASATGEVGVASVTCGPGLAQLGTALVSAARNRVPLVVFAGETPLGALWHNQTFAPEPFAAACETHIISIRDQKHALSRVRDAFHIARRDRAPVILSVPIDVQAQAFSDELRVDPAPDLSSRSGSRLDSAAARTIAEQLLAARNPVLLAGKGAVSSGADVGIAALANRVGALLATTLKAKGMFDDHPYSLGVCGGFASDTAREALAQCDLLLAFGASLNNYTLGGGDLMPKARIVQIDTAPDSVVAGRIVADESHASDAEKAVEAIMEALGNGHSEAVARTPELASDLRNRPADATDFDIEPGRADPRAVFSELETVLPAGVDIVSGAGHQGYFHTPLRGFDPRRYHVLREFGAIGNGLGHAIGVAATRPDGGTVLFEGDGGLWMHVQELECIARHGLKMLIVVSNDGGFGAEIHHLRHDGIDPAHAVFGHGDLAALAEAFGLDGRRVTGAGQISEAVRDYRKSDRAMLIDIQASDRVISPMFRRRLEKGH